MAQKLIHKTLYIEGMSCANCETKIEKALKNLVGIVDVKASYSSSMVNITFDAGSINLKTIMQHIEELDYKVIPDSAKSNQSSDSSLKINQLLGIGIIVFAIYMIIKKTIGFNFIPEVNQSMGYGILFVVGLLTSLHCIAMCGGINLSQCVAYNFEESSKLSRLKPSFLYNLGRVISYTIIGGIVGLLGSVVSFSGFTKGIVAIVSGLFMIIMGANMLGLFPALRRFVPRMPKFISRKLDKNKGSHGPLYVGLLNGLMPCGPLQAMQLYALGTGSFLAGSMSMFFFSLGTVPLMFGFGAISSLLSKKFTLKMLKVSAILIVFLGFIMINRGLNLSGINFATSLQDTQSSGNNSIAKVEGNIQLVTTTLTGGDYSPIVVQKGIPVKWTIKVAEGDLNGCNNPLTIPKYNMRKRLIIGDNLIEFTPKEEGNIPYTCWMGMISSNIKVVSDVSASSSIEDIDGAIPPANPVGSRVGGCCGG